MGWWTRRRLESKDCHDRLEAARALRHQPDPAALGRLIDRFGDDIEEVATTARAAVVGLGPAALPALLQALRASDWAVRSHAATAIGEIGDRRGVEPLGELLREARPGDGLSPSLGTDDHDTEQELFRDHAVGAAIRALSALGGSRAQELLRRVLAQRFTPEDVGWSLARTGDLEVAPLVSGLSDERPWVRERSAQVLKEVSWVAPDPSLRLRLAVALRAWEALIELGPAGIDALLAAFERERSSERASIAAVLGRSHDPRVTPVLVAALREVGRKVADQQVRLSESESAYRIAVASALNGLGWKPETENDRVNLATALGRWEDAATAGAGAFEHLRYAFLCAEEDARETLPEIARALLRSGARKAPSFLLHELGGRALLGVKGEIGAAVLAEPAATPILVHVLATPQIAWESHAAMLEALAGREIAEELRNDAAYAAMLDLCQFPKIEKVVSPAVRLLGRVGGHRHLDDLARARSAGPSPALRDEIDRATAEIRQRVE